MITPLLLQQCVRRATPVQTCAACGRHLYWDQTASRTGNPLWPMVGGGRTKGLQLGISKHNGWRSYCPRHYARLFPIHGDDVSLSVRASLMRFGPSGTYWREVTQNALKEDSHALE